MALGSTIYRFDIELSDVDRGVYESIALRVPMHPSESPSYLMTRILAFLLNYEERLVFSKGICDAAESAIFHDSFDGVRQLAIEIGLPSAERLHKTAKGARAVKVYTDRHPRRLRQQIKGKTIHNLDQILFHAFEPEFLNTLIDLLERKNSWQLTHTEGELYLTIGEQTVSGKVLTESWT